MLRDYFRSTWDKHKMTKTDDDDKDDDDDNDEEMCDARYSHTMPNSDFISEFKIASAKRFYHAVFS